MLCALCHNSMVPVDFGYECQMCKAFVYQVAESDDDDDYLFYGLDSDESDIDEVDEFPGWVWPAGTELDEI